MRKYWQFRGYGCSFGGGVSRRIDHKTHGVATVREKSDEL